MKSLKKLNSDVFGSLKTIYSCETDIKKCKMSPHNGSCMAESSSVRSLSSDDVSATKSRNKSCWARATDPAHRRGRRIQLLQMLVLPFIPILALIVQTANTLHDILIYRQ